MKDYVLGIKIGAAFDSTFGYTIERAKRSLKSLNRYTDLKLRLDSKITQAKEDLARSVSGFKSAAATALSMAVPIKIGASFEFEMARLSAILGADSKAMEKLEKRAMQLGVATMYSATDVGKAMQYLAMAGFKTSQILKTVAPTLNLATIGNLDLARAADISSDVLSGFGLKAAELNRVVNVMAKTISTSNTTIESLGESMKYVAPVARSLGVSVEETSAMLGLLHNVGIKGSMAGTTLRAIFSRLSAPTGEAAKALRTLGVQTTDAYGKLKPMHQILKELGESLKALPESKRMQFVKAIFGEEPAAGALELIVQADTGGLEKYIKEIENSKGTAEKMVKKMNDTVVIKFKSVLSALEGMFLTIYKPIEPILKKGLDILASSIRTLTTVLKPIAPILSPIVFGFGAFFVASKLAAAGVAFLRLQALLSQEGLLLLAGKLPFLSAEMNLFGKSSMFAGLSLSKMFTILKTSAVGLLTNPIFLIGTALALGAYLVIKNWDKVKSFFIGFWHKIKDIFGSIANVVKRVFGVFFSVSPIGVAYQIIKHFGRVKSFFAGFGHTVRNIFEFVRKAIKRAFVVTTPIGAAYEIIKNWSKVKEFFKGFGITIKGVFSSVFGAIKRIFGGISEVVSAPIKMIGKVFSFFKKPIKWFGGILGVGGDNKEKETHEHEKTTQKETSVFKHTIERISNREKETQKERLYSDSVVIHSININIRSDTPTKVIREEIPQIKAQIKRVILEVFDDLKRKQALAYNK